MTGNDLIGLMHQSHRRVDVTGTPDNGIIAALDLEGRIFTVGNSRVFNRVVPSAIVNRSNKNAYLNPGGDALWPAPEGTCFGYEYGTGKWRVPPSITGAVWEVIQKTENKTVIRAEIDLVNNTQLAIPCEFERHIEFKQFGKSVIQNITEKIRYIGIRTLEKSEFAWLHGRYVNSILVRNVTSLCRHQRQRIYGICMTPAYRNVACQVINMLWIQKRTFVFSWD